MSRIDALSIQFQNEAPAKLAEEYGKVIENLQHITLASRLKNKNLSGDPTAGSVEAHRFENITSKPYGYARGTARGGEKVKTKPVIIPIDDDTEFMEEIEYKDLVMFGVDGLIQRRTRTHQDGLAVELDTKFFAEAVAKGVPFTSQETLIEDEIEDLIVTLETLKNEFVSGVPRNVINIVCNPRIYGRLRNKINSIPNSNNLGVVGNWEGGNFNNVHIYSSVFLPPATQYIAMVDGAVAQPVRTKIYSPKAVDLSAATAFGIFAFKGTKAVMPDLILHRTTGSL